MNITILCVLGILVLFSYYIILGKWVPNTSYFTHPFWFGIDPKIVKMLSIFQIFAVIGFLIGVISWLKTPPVSGIMSKFLFITLFAFLVSAIVWPIATYYKIKWLVVLSLIITAISSILLLAGSIEDVNPKWYIILSFIFLCITTVLNDGILWNANYIIKHKVEI